MSALAKENNISNPLRNIFSEVKQAFAELINGGIIDEEMSVEAAIERTAKENPQIEGLKDIQQICDLQEKVLDEKAEIQFDDSKSFDEKIDNKLNHIKINNNMEAPKTNVKENGVKIEEDKEKTRID